MNQIAPINTSQLPHFPILNEMNESNTAAKRTATAKRLANTKNMDYQEWLKVRKQGIGSSEPYRVCRRLNILRDYSDEKTNLYPRN